MRAPLGDADGDTVPYELRDVVLAIVRDRPLEPVARISTTRTVDMLYDRQAPRSPSSATTWSPRRRARRRTADLAGVGARTRRGRGVRRWPGSAGPVEQSAVRRGRRARGPRFEAGRVLDAARGGSADAEPAPASSDPVRRAVAEQVDELLVWDRAVRADAWDSVHQMRVVTRKIRSLLQSSEESFGISDDAWVLDELRLLAGVLGVARDAEVLAEKYERALDDLPDDLVRGPIRERLVDGAKPLPDRVAAVVDRDALRAVLPVARRARRAGRRRARDAACRARKPPRSASAPHTRRSARPPRRRADTADADVPLRIATRPCTGFARAPSDFATPRPPRGRTRSPIGPRPSRRCSVTIRTRRQPYALVAAGGRPRTPQVRTPSPTACCISRRTTWPGAREEQLDDALKQLKKAVRDED